MCWMPWVVWPGSPRSKHSRIPPPNYTEGFQGIREWIFQSEVKEPENRWQVIFSQPSLKVLLIQILIYARNCLDALEMSATKIDSNYSKPQIIAEALLFQRSMQVSIFFRSFLVCQMAGLLLMRGGGVELPVQPIRFLPWRNAHSLELV